MSTAQGLKGIASYLGRSVAQVKRLATRSWNPLPIPKGRKGRLIEVPHDDLDAWRAREHAAPPVEIRTEQDAHRVFVVAMEMIERLNDAAATTSRSYALTETQYRAPDALAKYVAARAAADARAWGAELDVDTLDADGEARMVHESGGIIGVDVNERGEKI